MNLNYPIYFVVNTLIKTRKMVENNFLTKNINIPIFSRIVDIDLYFKDAGEL